MKSFEKIFFDEFKSIQSKYPNSSNVPLPILKDLKSKHDDIGDASSDVLQIGYVLDALIKLKELAQ